MDRLILEAQEIKGSRRDLAMMVFYVRVALYFQCVSSIPSRFIKSKE